MARVILLALRAPADSAATLAIVVFAACFAFALAGVAPSPYWLDSSEFAAASFELGIAHPPGHPLALLVGKVFALLPFGSVAFRAGVASAAASAAAAAASALLGREVARRAGEALGYRDVRVELLAGAASGLAFGLSHAALVSAVRPEVYALNAALLATAALLLARWDRGAAPPDSAPARARSPRAPLYGAALLLGCALANHHFLAVLFCIAAILFLAARALPRRLRPPPRAVLLVAGAGLCGLLLYVYLPARASRHPVADWGAPLDLERFVWTVSARAFQKSLGRAASGGAMDAAAALGAELSLLLPLALAGLYLLARLSSTRALAVLLGAGAALLGLAPALVGFDPENPDAYGYLSPAVALLCAAAAAAPAAAVALAPRLRRIGPPATALLAALVALVSLRAAPSISLARFTDTERFAQRLLDEAPPRAAVFSSYFQTVFALWYAQVVEGRRPDVEHVHPHFLNYPGYRDEAVRRAPSLGPLLGAHDLEPAAVLAAARARPVLLEHDLELADDLIAALRPGVLLDRVEPRAPGTSDPEAYTAAEVGRAALHRDLDAREPQTRRLLLWLDFLDAHLACSQGRPDQAAPAVARARALLGPASDPDLDELARRCNLPPR